MKKLTLIRHAKSDWGDMSLSDHDRPLNKRGLRDAPFMAQLMLDKGWSPQIFFSSTAKRALHTTTIFIDIMGLDESASIQTDARIYLAAPATLLSIIADFSSQWDHVALVGHNPGFTQLTNYFAGHLYLDNLPTCGMVEIMADDLEKWPDFLPEKTVVKEVHYPKKYQQ